MLQEFLFLASVCTSGVPATTLGALVSAESDFNPYAIGVVRGTLSRQPANLKEAMETVKRLENAGFNYSVGLAQINKVNFSRHELDNESMFDPCLNLAAGAKILTECYSRSTKVDQSDKLRAALSCYYSGTQNIERYSGYIERVVGRSTIDFGKIKVDARDRWSANLKPIVIKRIGEKSKNAQVAPTRWNTTSTMVVKPINGQPSNSVLVLGDRPITDP